MPYIEWDYELNYLTLSMYKKEIKNLQNVTIVFGETERAHKEEVLK